MTSTRTRAALVAGAIGVLLLSACGDDGGDGSTAATTAAGDSAVTTVASATTGDAADTAASGTTSADDDSGGDAEEFVAAMTPLCEDLDSTVNEATAPLFSADGPPDPAAAQEALVTIDDAIQTFVTAAAAVPVPEEPAEAARIVSGYEEVGAMAGEASASPEDAMAFFEADDPRQEVAADADAIGLTACGTGGTFAAMTEVAASEAPDDAVRVEAFDFGYAGLPATLPAGEVTFDFTNTAEQDHELVLLPLQPAADADEVLEQITTATDDEIEALFGEVAAGPPAGVYAGPGGAAFGTTELQAGPYAVVCFIPDEGTGKPHSQLGMAVVVDVA
jgi:hypothetical protein